MSTERKSVSDIVGWLQAAGIAFVAGYYISDYFQLSQRLSDMIEAVRDGIVRLRHGSELNELDALAQRLEAAGIRLPVEVEDILHNPRDEDEPAASAAANIAYVRGYLEEALRALEQAKDQADEGKSASRDAAHKSARPVGAHALYR